MSLHQLPSYFAGLWQHPNDPVSVDDFRSWISLCYVFVAHVPDIGHPILTDDWGLYEVRQEDDQPHHHSIINREEVRGEGPMPLGDFFILMRSNLAPLQPFMSLLGLRGHTSSLPLSTGVRTSNLSEHPLLHLPLRSSSEVLSSLSPPEEASHADTLRRDDSSPPIIAQQMFSRRASRSSTASSLSSNSRSRHFSSRLRGRDPMCCACGRDPLRYCEEWGIFEAAHIFPRSEIRHWTEQRYYEQITDTGNHLGRYKIDSIQNGLLLCPLCLKLFDKHRFTVNPDKGYKIFDFTSRGELHGRTLRLSVPVESPERPLDDLFRDHLEQAVLKNVRGAAEDEDWDNEWDDDWDDDWTESDELCTKESSSDPLSPGKPPLETQFVVKLAHPADDNDITRRISVNSQIAA